MSYSLSIDNGYDVFENLAVYFDCRLHNMCNLPIFIFKNGFNSKKSFHPHCILEQYAILFGIWLLKKRFASAAAPVSSNSQYESWPEDPLLQPSDTLEPSDTLDYCQGLDRYNQNAIGPTSLPLLCPSEQAQIVCIYLCMAQCVHMSHVT